MNANELLESSDLFESSPLTEQLTPLIEMLPLLVASLSAILIVLLIAAIMNARGRAKERRAIIQTAEDAKAIRELLEQRQRLQPQPRSAELANDPQLPAQP